MERKEQDQQQDKMQKPMDQEQQQDQMAQDKNKRKPDEQMDEKDNTVGKVPQPQDDEGKGDEK